MILQKLADYYDRVSQDSATTNILPKPGYSLQQISFAVVLNTDGTLNAFQSVTDGNDKKPRALKLLVPGQGKPSGSGINPCFLWDNAAYLVGFKVDDPKPDRTRESFERFRQEIRDAESVVNSPTFSAVCKFLRSWSPEQAMEHAAELTEITTNFGVFRIAGKTRYVHDDPAVVAYWAAHGSTSSGAHMGLSLVTGQREPIAILHEPKIKGVVGAQSAGALLVSFNAPAYESYGREQGANAPVDVATTFKYTNALNYLLGRSDRRTIVGDATYTYWADRPTPLEDYFDDSLGDAPPPKPDAPPEQKERAERVRVFLERLRDGDPLGGGLDADKAVGFYVLGLSPNASRLSVRFWEQTNVGRLEDRLSQHLRDMHLSGARPGDAPLVIRRIVEATGRAKMPGGSFQGYDSDAVSPMLAGAIARAIFTGSNYPLTLLGAMLNRLRSDGYVSHPRVAAIKACIVRNNRKTFPTKEALVSLDVTRIDPAYVTGRLFALLERVQSDAAGGDLNSTIKDRYFSAASATPAGIFPRLIRLSQHHLTSLGKEKPGLKVNHDKLCGEIIGKLDGFATQFNLEDQGLFAIGYYHQRQDFFTSKKKEEGDAK
jgi:CRISPR-associated protein Csd1